MRERQVDRWQASSYSRLAGNQRRAEYLRWQSRANPRRSDKDLLVLADRYPVVSPAEFWARYGGP